MIDKQTKIINLDYIDPFYYKLFIIKNIDFFKSYINKNMLKKQVCNSLFYNLIKKKNLSIDISCAKFNKKLLEFIST